MARILVTGANGFIGLQLCAALEACSDYQVRAVTRQPYAGLPPEKYELWRDNTLTFDPSRMLAVN